MLKRDLYFCLEKYIFFLYDINFTGFHFSFSFKHRKIHMEDKS